MGNMPVIRDLIVDMDAVHWKKIQRVTPWLINKEPIPEREYIVPHENMVDVTQTMACIQCGACVSDCLSMEVDPGSSARPRWPRPTGSSATRATPSTPSGSNDLAEDPHGIYDCTHCFNCIDACPKGVDADEPDHAPAPQRRQRLRDRRTATTATATSTRSSRTSATTGCCTRPTCCADSYGGKFHPRAVPELLGGLPTAADRAGRAGKMTPRRAASATSHKAPKGSSGSSRGRGPRASGSS